MPRVDREALADVEVERVYLAAELDEARRVEAALDAGGIDYVVEVEPYWKNTLMIFPTRLAGAAFYVEGDAVEGALVLIRGAGLVRGLPEVIEGD